MIEEVFDPTLLLLGAVVVGVVVVVAGYFLLNKKPGASTFHGEKVEYLPGNTASITQTVSRRRKPKGFRIKHKTMVVTKGRFGYDEEVAEVMIDSQGKCTVELHGFRTLTEQQFNDFAEFVQLVFLDKYKEAAIQNE